jgi:hypothetical protein
MTLMAASLVLALFASMGLANAADPQSSGPLGTVFSASGSGFTPGEKIVLWTTDPNGQALDAGYIFADNSGNFQLKIDTLDPNALALTSNYTTLIDNYNSDGSLASEYWETFLKDTPGQGQWYITAYGTSSAVTKVFSFSVTATATS